MANNLTIIGRLFFRNRAYTVLNLLGLATGFAVFIFAMIYVYFETHFENFHTNRKSIYRATYRFSPPGGFESHWARVPFDYINNLPQDVPGVKTIVRFQNHARKYVRIGDDKFKPAHAYVADNDVFTVFNFDLISGDPKTALAKPHGVVITQTLARKYFGNADPMGKELFVIGDLDSAETVHHVTGVMRDLPSNTHLPVEMLLSFRDQSERTGWAYTYVLLDEGADIQKIASQMPAFVRKYSTEDDAKNDAIVFQSLTDIHLTSNLARELVPNGKLMYVKVAGIAALLILLIAAINFMNLSSAMALGRSKEIGMRKIMGAGRQQLVAYLLGESVVQNLVALIIGAGVTYLVYPSIQEMIAIEFLPSPLMFTASLTGIAILVGLLSGIYPVVLLMALKPVVMLKSTKAISVGKPEKQFSLKRAMVTLQFCISILLLGSALIAYQQFTFMQQKNLGMQREQIIAIPGVPDKVKDRFETFKARLTNQKGITTVSACMEVPSREIRDAGPVLVEGVNNDPAKAPRMDIQVIDHDFANLMGLTFVAGGNIKPPTNRVAFSNDASLQDYLLNQPREYLINETAMRQLGWTTAEDAIGQKISWSIGDMRLASGSVVGVVKDFHQESLRNKVDPVVMVQEPVWLRTFLIKVKPENVQSTVEGVKATWDDMFPFYDMEYFFLDDLYNNLYKNDRVQLQMLFIFSALAIIIAFIGLVGMVAYALKTRTRELAVRQVLGARVHDLIRLMSREYLVVLLVGGMIAVPVSIYALTQWLQGFAYHVDISAGSYVLAFALMITLLVITVGLQTLKASRRNPAQTLRDE